MTMLFGFSIALAVLNIVLLVVLVRRSAGGPIESAVRDELRQSRDDAAKLARELRDELGQGLKSGTDTLVNAVGALGTQQHEQLEGCGTQLSALSEATESRLDSIRTVVDEKLQATQEQTAAASQESSKAAQALRDEVTNRLTTLQDSMEKRYDGMRQTVDEKLQGTHDQTTKASRELREEVATALKGNADSVGQQLKALADTTQSRLDAVKGTIEVQLNGIRDGNAAGLEAIRKTVDEQLQSTLEKRLTESFKLVSGHLESVQRGLGEMKELANGVGDLKRVLTNVKARGTWAEFQLGAILEEILTPEQFAKNVQTREHSGERVEFAVRLPGRTGDPETCVWLPIDSKFPQEPYSRLMDAAEAADMVAMQSAVVELARAIRLQAQTIHDKYLCPPTTTDFAIMFLPTEGLYAEVLRVPNLAAELQHTFRVMVAGPTSLAALLSSLRMGFQTVAIERRANEIWTVLRAVKTEFAKFGGVLTKVKQQLDRASRTIDATGVRTRAMERQLREVEELPAATASEVLNLPEATDVLEQEPALVGGTKPV